MPEDQSDQVRVFDAKRVYRPGDPELSAITSSDSTLRFWRCRGGGPPFVKITPGPRGRVGYLGQDLNQFLSDRRVKVA